MDVYQREKELCETFKSKIHYNMKYEINSKEINIIVYHNGNSDITLEKNRLDKLYEIFKLDKLGWKKCNSLHYIDIDNRFINKHFFKSNLKKRKYMIDLMYKNIKSKDGYLICSECESKIGFESICTDCCCYYCLELNDDCDCF